MKGKLLVLVGILVLLGGSAVSFGFHSDHYCYKCHTIHKSGDPNTIDDHGVPLWSKLENADGLPNYTLYDSRTFEGKATIIQPDGPSRLCLGCHDGSFGGETAFTTRSSVFDPGDLSRSHPISFTYDIALAARVRNGALRDPATTASGLGGPDGQCPPCEDGWES